jgi:imidazolonepropionase-like amidohydrolase
MIMNNTKTPRPPFNTISCGVILAVLCCTTQLLAWNPEIPGAPQTQPIAIVGVKLHTVSGPVISSGTILFEDGKITALGVDIPLPKGTRQIKGKRLHVYPALFDPYSQIGLTEINSIRATNDYRETGSINPNVMAHVAVNPDSELIPVARANGVLLALTAPSGGLVSGQSAVIQLDGWTFEDLTLKPGVGMHIQWPTQGSVANFTSSGGSSADANQRLKLLFDQVKDYHRARQMGDHPIDLKMEAMVPVITGKMPVIVHANTARTIQAAVAFCSERKLQMILLGGYDAEHCAALLKEHDIPVVVSGIHRLPRRRSDPYDAPYTLPERLRQQGVRFCIAGISKFGGPNVRNLPYQAGTAVAYGLPQDEAIKAITLSPAEIYGVAHRVGSLEVGKDATLIITNGSPLETTTRTIVAFIQGREVSLANRHTRLYRKYRARYQP